MTDEEKNMSFQEFVQHIELRGEARGEARGAERERQSIITIAADLIPRERLEHLRAIQDLELLKEAVRAALRESLM